MENKINMVALHGFSESIAHCEASGIGKCFEAYANHCAEEYIMEIGFNKYSGYTYIALENGVTICSQFGADVEWQVVNMETGEEFFYESFYEIKFPE